MTTLFTQPETVHYNICCVLNIEYREKAKVRDEYEKTITNNNKASVAMVHSVPELVVTDEVSIMRVYIDGS